MRNLIEALTIILKYGDVPFPTHCEHDTLYITSAVPPEEFAAEDLSRLDELGILVDEETGGFYSFRYGSS